VTHIFGIALILLPLGLIATVLSHNGAWFAGAIILAVEIVIGSILYTIYKAKFKR
jgi:hypothetical protein